jgi:tetratricopeptide (TPR) repeat protein
MASAQALIIGLIALLVIPRYAFYFDVTPKAVVLLAGTAWLLILAVRGRESPRGPRLFATLLLLNAASLAISTAFSPHPAVSFYGSTWRCLGAAMQCVAMLFAWLVAWQATGRPERVRTILRGIAIVAMLAAACSIVRPPGTLGDAGHLAVWLAMTSFLCLALAKMETRQVWRGVAYTAAALSLAVLCVGCIRAKPWKDEHPLLWRDSLSMAMRRPWAGFGSEVFLSEFPRSESKALAEQDPDVMYESPRNAFLDALVSQGAPGFAILWALCFAGFRAAWRRTTRWIAAALAAGIVGLQFTSFTIPTAVLFLTAVAVATALAEEPGARRPTPVLAGIAPFVVVALLYFALRLTVADRALAITRQLLEAGELRAATAQYESYGVWALPGASADLWYARSWLEIARSSTDNGVKEQALTISAQAAWNATWDSEEPYVAWYTRAQISALQDDFEDAATSLRQAVHLHPNWYRPHWMLAQQLLRASRPDEARKQAALAAELDAGHHPEVTKQLRLP